jgi:hypothetical protein
MKVIDILLEAVPGSGQIARLLLPAAARAWNAEKQAAFRQAVEALEDTLYLARSQPTPLPTSQLDAYKVIQQAAPKHVADKDFSQAVFSTAEDRVAKRIGAENAAASGTAAPKTTPAAAGPTAPNVAVDAVKLTAAQQATKNAKNILAIGAFGAAAYDVVFNSFVDYYRNQQEFLARVRAGKMTAEQAKQADNQQKMILVANIASVVVFPSVVSKIPSWSAGVAGWLLRVLKITNTPPLKLRQLKDGTFIQITQKDTVPGAASNSLAAFKYAAWGAWIGLLNSNEPIKGTAGYALYDQDGNPSGTVGRDMTPKEIVAWFAIHKMWGVSVVQWASDAFQWLWNLMPDALSDLTGVDAKMLVPGAGDTQRQAIQKAAGQPVTPNTVAKPPKKEKIGNTTWHGDWED